MMTDPIADLLTRIRNASRARREKVDIPWSRIKEGVAQLLIAEGYARECTIGGEGADKRIRLFLSYAPDGSSVIRGIRRVSRPSLRVYSKASDVPAVRNGLGVSILSTPVGLLVDREARRRNIGGEILCEVW